MRYVWMVIAIMLFGTLGVIFAHGKKPQALKSTTQKQAEVEKTEKAMGETFQEYPQLLGCDGRGDGTLYVKFQNKDGTDYVGYIPEEQAKRMGLEVQVEDCHRYTRNAEKLGLADHPGAIDGAFRVKQLSRVRDAKQQESKPQ